MRGPTQEWLNQNLQCRAQHLGFKKPRRSQTALLETGLDPRGQELIAWVTEMSKEPACLGCVRNLSKKTHVTVHIGPDGKCLPPSALMLSELVSPHRIHGGSP